MLARPEYQLITARTFLEFSFGDRKAECDAGVVRVLDGVTARHAIVQGNLAGFLATQLRGRGNAVFNSLLPIVTNDYSVRVADVTVSESGHTPPEARALTVPQIIVEICRGGNRAHQSAREASGISGPPKRRHDRLRRYRDPAAAGCPAHWPQWLDRSGL